MCGSQGRQLNYKTASTRYWLSLSKHYQKESNATKIDLPNLPMESLINDETNDDDFYDNMTETKSGIKKQTHSRHVYGLIVKPSQKSITVSSLCFLFPGEIEKLI